MALYILKSILCLGILWAVYHFWLSKEQLFKFNRLYLVLAVIFSLTAPLITFETITYLDPVPIVESDVSSAVILESGEPIVIETQKSFNWNLLLLFLYAGVVSLLALRFITGLVKLGRNIKNNPNKKWHDASLILLLKPLVPHTFLNYIFINKNEYEQDKITEELLLHEYEHVKQKHSYDILFIELVQLVFWFNPFIHLIKKSIKLNHEFLADQAVLKTNVSVNSYQELLLKTVGLSHPTFLSSSINYSITKKRLKMMTKSNQKTKRWGFTFLLLPLFAILLYSFSSHQEVIQERTIAEQLENEAQHVDSSPIKHLYARSIELELLEDGYYEVDELKVRKDDFASALENIHTDLTKAERDKVINLHVKTTNKIPFAELRSIQQVIAQYGYHRIVTPFQEIVRSKGNDPMKWSAQEILDANIQHEKDLQFTNQAIGKWLRIRINGKKIVINGKATTLEKFAGAIDKLTANWTAVEMKTYKSDVQIQNVPNDFLKKLNAEYKKTNLYKANPTSHGLIPPPPPPPSQVGEVIEVPMPPSTEVSTSEIEEYNSIVKKLTAVTDKEKIIKLKELKKITDIHNRMSKAQRKEALPLPNIPPPPMDTIFTYKRLANRIMTNPKNRKANLVYLRKLYKDMNSTQRSKVAAPEQVEKTHMVTLDTGETMEIVEDPIEEIRETPPPPPKSPLDHIIDMAKKGATFYIGGKKVTSDKAIKYAKENKSFNLETRQINSKTPSVYIIKKKEVIEIIEESGNRGPSVGSVIQTNSYYSKSGIHKFIKEMYDKGAEFYLDGKVFPQKKVLDLIKNNSHIGVESFDNTNGAHHTVKLSSNGYPLKGVEQQSAPESTIKNVKKKAKAFVTSLAQDQDKRAAYYRNATFKIEVESGNYATKTYSELTQKEKSRLFPPPPPPMQRKPTKKQLTNWGNSNKYDIWVDSKRVKNAEISELPDNYFAHFNESKLMKNAKNYGKHYYQVNLYSNQKWESFVGDGKIRALSSSAVVTIKLNNKIMVKGT